MSRATDLQRVMKTASGEDAPRKPRNASYAYRAIRADGVIEQGVTSAVGVNDLRARLLARGVIPIDVRSPTEGSDALRRIPVEHLASGLRLLASIAGSGLSLDRSLGAFVHVAPTGWSAELAERLRAGVREGDGFSDVLERSVEGVPSFVLGIIAAAEANGALASGLDVAASELEETARTRASIRAALAYPALLAIAGLTMSAVLVGVVLPKFALIVSDLGQQLPRSARVLIAAGSAARLGAVPTAVLMVVLAVVLRVTVVGDSARRAQLSERWLRLPLVGRLSFQAAAARSISTLGSLLASGVPISNAMLHAADAAGDPALRARFLAARDRVIGGERLSSALSRAEAVPASALQVIRAAEATGVLPPLLRAAARIERERTLSEIRRLVRLIEPGLILAMGALIAFVAASLLQAIYSAVPTT